MEALIVGAWGLKGTQPYNITECECIADHTHFKVFMTWKDYCDILSDKRHALRLWSDIVYYQKPKQQLQLSILIPMQ